MVTHLEDYIFFFGIWTKNLFCLKKKQESSNYFNFFFHIENMLEILHNLLREFSLEKKVGSIACVNKTDIIQNEKGSSSNKQNQK